MSEHEGISISTSPWPAEIAQAVVAATEDLLIVLNDHGAVQHVNGAVIAALQTSPSRLIGHAFVDLLDAGSRAKGQRLLEQAQQGKTSSVFELNHLVDNNQVVMIAYRAVPLQQTANVKNAVLLMGRPTAETVATTERLIAFNRRLGALFGVAAASSRSLVLNDVLQHALAVALTELDLCAGAIYLADVPVELDQSQRPPLAPHQLQLAVQQGFSSKFVSRLGQPESITSLWNANVQAELQSVMTGIGDEVGIEPDDLERMAGPLLSIAATPLISENRLLGWLYVVTDRYRAFESDELDVLRTIGNVLGPPIENARLYDALRQTSGRLAAVLDSIDSGVLLTDAQGIVRYANTRLGTLLATNVVHWPGQRRADVMPISLVPYTRSATMFDLDLWETQETHHRILRRFAEPVSDLNGSSLGAIEVYSDITEIHEMNRLKDEFVAAAAHDLKTPVTAVKGYAQIALRIARKLDEPKLVQQLTMINARSDDLAMLMDALLDMSRIQAGRLRLDIEPMVVQQLVTRSIQHFEFDLQRKQRSIACDMPEEPLEVEWDRHRIERVLINLIGNAIKYSPDGGDISVRVRHNASSMPDDDNLLEIAVTDQGIGIPPHERHLIFERFYRTAEAVDYGFRGTGIGLYITQSIVELHGGRIWAGDALHGGRGTTMFVKLPRLASVPTQKQ